MGYPNLRQVVLNLGSGYPNLGWWVHYLGWGVLQHWTGGCTPTLGGEGYFGPSQGNTLPMSLGRGEYFKIDLNTLRDSFSKYVKPKLFPVYNLDFHKCTKFTVVANFVFLHLQFSFSFVPYDVGKSRLDASGYTRIIFQGCRLHWPWSFLMTQVKPSSQQSSCSQISYFLLSPGRILPV